MIPYFCLRRFYGMTRVLKHVPCAPHLSLGVRSSFRLLSATNGQSTRQAAPHASGLENASALPSARLSCTLSMGLMLGTKRIECSAVRPRISALRPMQWQRSIGFDSIHHDLTNPRNLGNRRTNIMASKEDRSDNSFGPHNFNDNDRQQSETELCYCAPICPAVSHSTPPHSHSMVPGGFDVTS
jgi:hypothetical protein